ncbi:MAG: DUF4412 domain-containing protein [Candidatus Binatia bacterium]
MRYALGVIGSLCGGLLLWADFASAGWVIDQVTKGSNERQQIIVQNNQVKISVLDSNGQPETVTLLDTEAQSLTVVDFQKRYYMTSTLQEYRELMTNIQKKVAPKMAEAMQKMQEQMKGLPLEQRKMMEQMMGSRMSQMSQDQTCTEPPAAEVRKTDQRDTIAGYSAVRYDVEVDGKADSQLWIAKDITVGQELDPEKMERFRRELAVIAACRPMKQHAIGESQAWRLVKEGYPARMVHGESGRVVEVVKAEKREVPAAELAPPKGFLKKTPQDMFKM